MNFRHLSKEVKQGVKALTLDEEFQKRFGTDKVLDELDQQKYNVAEELQVFNCVVNEKVFFCDRTVNPITPKLWSFIWLIGSPFINPKKEVTETDIDLLLYLLQNPLQDINPTSVIIASLGYCMNHQVQYETAFKIIQESIKLAFKPMNLFPKTNTAGNNLLYYDTEWLTATVARVHTVTGLTPKEILNMPMTAVCYYYAQFAKMNGEQNIYRRSPEEILIAQDMRCCELIVQRLIENGVIKEEQRETIYKIISTPEEAENK